MLEPQTVQQISLEQLSPNPLQPRGTITADSLTELVESIKEHGVLEPLVAADTPAGLQIIAGERRWRAAKLAGVSTIPVITKKTTPKGMLEMALVENVQRSDLNPLEKARAFDRLINEFGLTTGEVAKRIGKSPAFVSNSLRMLTLPDALKDGLLTGMITEGHARALSAIDDPQKLIEAYKIILREAGSVRRAEELARRMKQGNAISTRSVPTRPPLIISQQTDEIREKLLIKLDSINQDYKNIVKLSRSRNETKLIIHLKGNPDETELRLQTIFKGITTSQNP